MTATANGTTPEATLFRKIAEVMGEVDRIPKRGRNDFHKYDYVLEADLVDAVRQKLAAKNVALIPSLNSMAERPYTTEKGKHSVITTAHVTFTFVCGETGAMFRADWAGQGDDPADKGLYAAYTGALKYFLMKTFLIPTGDDPESRTGTDERAQGRQAPGNGQANTIPAPGPKMITEPQERRVRKALKDSHTVTPEQIAAATKRILGREITSAKQLTSREASKFIEGLDAGALPDPDNPTDVPDQEQFEVEVPAGTVGTDPAGDPF